MLQNNLFPLIVLLIILAVLFVVCLFLCAEVMRLVYEIDAIKRALISKKLFTKSELENEPK